MKKKILNEKFLIILSIAILILVISLALIYSSLNIKKNQKMAQDNLVEITDGVAKTIDAWLNEKKKQIIFFSIKNIVKNYLKNEEVNIEEFFSLVVTIDDDYETIFMATKNGEIIINSGNRIIPNKNIQTNDFWDTLVERGYQLVIGEEIQPSPITGNRSLFILNGVFDKNNELLGVIGSVFDWEKFIAKFILPQAVGQTGMVALINEQGNYIAHPDPNLHLKNLSHLPIKTRMKAEKNGFQKYDDGGNSKYIAYTSLEELGWIVIATVHERELIEGSIYLRNILFLIAVIFLIFIVFIIGYIDIFKLKKAESELKDSQRKYNLIFNQGNDGIFVHPINPQGIPLKFTQVNQVFCDLLHHKKEAVLNLTPFEIFLFENENQYEAIIEQVVENKHKSIETKIFPRKKPRIYIELRMFLMESSGSRSILGFIRDITKRIVFEMELKESRDYLNTTVRERTKKLRETNVKLERQIKEKDEMGKALRESEEKYRNLVERANDGILVVQDEKIKFANKKIQEMLNYSQKEITEINLSDIIAPENRKKMLERYHKRIMGQNVKSLYEGQLITKDNKIVDVEVNAGIINYEGKAADFIFVRNISERKKMEQEKQKHFEQLVQTDKLVALGTLVSGVAHEINNPNNSIMLNIPVINDAWQHTIPILDEYKKSCGDFVLAGMPYSVFKNYIFDLLADIQDSSGRINTIVNDLKNFAKPSKSELMEEVNINYVVRSSINLVSNLIMKSTENFKVLYGEKMPLIQGNFQRLEQVVVNLVQNACQAVSDRKKKITLSTEFIKKDEVVEIRVTDEGTGIKPEYLKQIMDPFFTTKREKGGTGLGLSVSMSLIKEHLGTLDFESQMGKGTTAIVRLPVKTN